LIVRRVGRNRATKKAGGTNGSLRLPSISIWASGRPSMMSTRPVKNDRLRHVGRVDPATRIAPRAGAVELGLISVEELGNMLKTRRVAGSAGDEAPRIVADGAGG